MYKALFMALKKHFSMWLQQPCGCSSNMLI